MERSQPIPKTPLPHDIQAFLREPNPAVVACVRPDGFPLTVVTWYDWSEDELFVMNVHASRRRLKWMTLNDKVAATVIDRNDMNRHVSLIGNVIEIEPDSQMSIIDSLARRYTGKPYLTRETERETILMRPDVWHGWDDSQSLSIPSLPT